MDTQIQAGEYDSGFYAMANVTALVHIEESAFDSIVQSFPLYQLNGPGSKANFFLARIELM